MNAQAVLDFIEEIGVLKNLPRTGWRFRGIKDAESIADHCYRVSLLSMILADVLTEQDVPLDVEKVMRLALLHEIAEARVGDLPFPDPQIYTPRDQRSGRGTGLLSNPCLNTLDRSKKSISNFGRNLRKGHLSKGSWCGLLINLS